MLIGLRFNFQLALDGAGDSVTWVVVIGYERGKADARSRHEFISNSSIVEAPLIYKLLYDAVDDQN